MRSRRSRWLRLIQFIGLALVLVIMGAGCAGNDSSASSGSNPSNPAADANVADGGGSAGDDAQVSPSLTPEPTGDPVAATVNGQPITMAEFEAERNRRAMGMAIEPATAEAFDQSVLNSMIDQTLIDQYATQQGIAVSDADVDEELAIQQQIAQESGQTLEDLVAAQLYTMPEYREAIRDMLLWGRVSEQVTADVSATATQVHARHILVADEATARSIIDQLNQGADFAQLAMQYSLDGSTAPSGGDLDWVSRGDLLQPEIEEAIFSLAPGTRAPEPVHSSLGYHVIETLEVVEDRPLDQAALAQKKEQVFLDWLTTQRSTAVIEQHLDAGS